jgi:two-component system alkaline phosphatase synthesis response regulator PhoP/two-component system response regulator VicR
MLGRDLIVVGDAQRGKAHVLVVDDERHICRLLEVNLQRAGYRVTCAHSLPAARDVVRRDLPHLVILDTMMPRDLEADPPDTGDCSEFSRELREDPATAELPVIIMAARPAEVEFWEKRVQPCLERDQRPYVRKPLNPMEILVLAKKLLDPSPPEPPPWRSFFF